MSDNFMLMGTMLPWDASFGPQIARGACRKHLLCEPRPEAINRVASHIEARICEFIDNSGGSAGYGAIRDNVLTLHYSRYAHTTLAKYLSLLVTDGRLRRVHKGLYESIKVEKTPE